MYIRINCTFFFLLLNFFRINHGSLAWPASLSSELAGAGEQAESDGGHRHERQKLPVPLSFHPGDDPDQGTSIVI